MCMRANVCTQTKINTHGGRSPREKKVFSHEKNIFSREKTFRNFDHFKHASHVHTHSDMYMHKNEYARQEEPLQEEVSQSTSSTPQGDWDTRSEMSSDTHTYSYGSGYATPRTTGPGISR